MGRLSGQWLGVVPAAALCCAVILGACGGLEPGSVKDEAMRAGLTAKDLPGSDDDYLRDMDRGLDAEAVHQALLFLSKEEAWKAYNRGRNNWVVWTAGNDTLWDYLANNSFGAFDLLKIVSSHPSIRYCGNTKPVYGYGHGGMDDDAKDKQSGYAEDKSTPAPYPPGYYAYEEDDECKGDDRRFYEVSRQNRWKYLGLVNEPGLRQWKAPERCASPDGKAVRDIKPSDPNDKTQWVGRPSGPMQEVRARREVILSAGAYVTPQLLMLSGIGPKDVLERPDIPIPVRVDLPGVGRTLQDRYEVGIVAKAKGAFPLLRRATFHGPPDGQTKGDEFFEKWRREGKGLYATNGAVVGFLARSSVAENDEPDLFIFGVPGEFTGYYTGWSEDSVAAPHDKWTWLLLKAHARFRGRVTITSSDPLDPPVVDFNYFERDAGGAPTPDTAKDLTAMREGVRLINTLIERSTKLRLHPEVMQGVDLQTDAGIDQFVQDRAWGHHASCTCKIGGDGDPDAVLDSSFRVRGTRGLRVVDASVFPRIPGFFVVMPIYMIAEKAADAILADAQ